MANKFTSGSRFVRALGTPCPYCEREMAPQAGVFPTLDHVVPYSRGGRRTIWACDDCNQVKGDLMPEEWAEFRRRHPRWWEMPKKQAGKARSLMRQALPLS